MRILRAADREASPWKNGGGVTREVAAWPPGAGLDDFEWRLSLADIAADGPFSYFPGVDRVLTLIAGEGLVLDVAGETKTLDAASPPLAFPGDAKASARLAAGPVRDFNLMVRRDLWRAEVYRLGARPTPVEGLAFVLLLEPVSMARIQLEALDILRFEADEAMTLDFPITTRALIAELRTSSAQFG
ncbi:MAG: HutD family protein [Caulobacter sp.]|nr:HutD family protein [Caulobacter sp.]